MPRIRWDDPKNRTYELGLDRGVLYLPDGSAVPWNGLKNIVESTDTDVNPIYFEGRVIDNIVTIGSFTAKLTALTFPDEFASLAGLAEIGPGAYIGEQAPEQFALCYRTRINNAVSNEVGYKLHILFNLTAVASDRSYESLGDSPEPTEFEWSISASPEPVSGYLPSATFVVNSTELDPWLLEDIENRLYGIGATDGLLIPMQELIEMVKNFARVIVTDNEDGTWTATTARDSLLQLSSITPGYFDLFFVKTTWIDENTYTIRTTVEDLSKSLVKVVDNGNGTWTARTDDDVLIDVNEDGTFTIYEAPIIFEGEPTYTLSTD